jgi:type I protein arginine methyltransferase
VKRIRPPDLSLSFEDDGKVLVRAPTRGIGARVPSIAIGILSFCGSPRDEAEVAEAFGPVGAQLYLGLANAGLLMEASAAEATPLFFENFAAVDIHRRMLDDEPRLQAYAAAIAEVVTPEMSVLDAGTGSGVLAALAARAGAKRVVAIDNSDIIALAQEVFKRSDLPQVEVIKSDIRDVELAEPVDVIVTETFGSLALAEGSVGDILLCSGRNLKPTGTVIPNAIDFWLAPVGDPAVLDQVIGSFSKVEGVDLSPLADAAMNRAISLQVDESTLLHQGKRLMRLPYPTGGSSVVGDLTFDVSGRCVGLCGWFDLRLSPSVNLSTGPFAPTTHWYQTFFPIEPLDLDEPLTLGVELTPAPDDRRAYELHTTWSSGDWTKTSFHRIR